MKKITKKIITPAIVEGDLSLLQTTDAMHDAPHQTLPSAGLGDTIKKITSLLGIEQCDGCVKRQERFNKLFPWLKGERELFDTEKELMVRVNGNPQVVNDDVNALFRLYNELFKSRLERCNCPGLLAQIVTRINTWNS